MQAKQSAESFENATKNSLPENIDICPKTTFVLTQFTTLQETEI